MPLSAVGLMVAIVAVVVFSVIVTVPITVAMAAIVIVSTICGVVIMRATIAEIFAVRTDHACAH